MPVAPVLAGPVRRLPVPAAQDWPGLAEDLTTNWLPDAVAGAGCGPDGPIGPVGRIDVATGSGCRSVVLAPVGLRIRGHLLAQASLGAAEAALSPGVFGYRDAAGPYREDWAAFRAAAARLAAVRAVEVRFDVRGFFAAVPAAALAVHGPDTERFAREVEERYGQCLLPGHRWARRFANTVLDPVDRALGAPFVRWQDDYRVFVRDAAEAEAVLAAAADGLGRIGLSLNAAKTRVGEPEEPAERWGPPGAASWAAAVGAGDVRRLKFLLRVAAQDAASGRRDGGGVPTGGLSRLVSERRVLAPRAAWALSARAAGGDGAAAAELAALAGVPDPWVSARALAGLAAHPSLAGAAPARAVAAAADSPHAAVRALAARLLHAAGRPFPSSVPHVDRVLRGCSPSSLAGVAPEVRTTL